MAHPCIILADPNANRRERVAGALRADGYEVVEADRGQDVIAHAEYLAAVRGRRRPGGAIVGDSFAIVANPALQEHSVRDVKDILERAHWDIRMVVLPEGPAEGPDLGTVRTLVRSVFRDTPPAN
jgi:CheY-like chemotaxis protein